MQLLKVKGGFAVLSKITGFQIRRPHGKEIASGNYHDFFIVAEAEGGAKYTLSESFIAQDEDIKENFQNKGADERIRAFVLRYVMENTVDTDEAFQKASCGCSAGCSSGSCESHGNPKKFSKKDDGPAEFHFHRGHQNHENPFLKFEYHPKDEESRKRLEDFADVIEAVSRAFADEERKHREFQKKFDEWGKR